MIKLLSIMLMISLPKTTVQSGKDKSYLIDEVCNTHKNYSNLNKDMMGNKQITYFYDSGEPKEDVSYGEAKKITMNDGKILIAKKVEVQETEFRAGSIVLEEIINLQSVNSIKEGFLTYYGCAYSKFQKMTGSFFFYTIYIITENIETDLLESASLFKESLKKSERLTHYKNLFSNIKILHSYSYALLDIKPKNITPTAQITPENDFSLKFTEFSIMRKFETVVQSGSKEFLAPSFFAGNFKSSFQRDIFSLLLTIAGLEYGMSLLLLVKSVMLFRAIIVTVLGN